MQNSRLVAKVIVKMNAHLKQLVKAENGSHQSWFHLFKHFDADGTGRIDEKELEKALRGQLGLSASEMSSEEYRHLWDFIETGGDGHVEVQEFCEFMRTMQHEQRLRDRRARRASVAKAFGERFGPGSARARRARGRGRRARRRRDRRGAAAGLRRGRDRRSTSKRSASRCARRSSSGRPCCRTSGCARCGSSSTTTTTARSRSTSGSRSSCAARRRGRAARRGVGRRALRGACELIAARSRRLADSVAAVTDKLNRALRDRIESTGEHTNWFRLFTSVDNSRSGNSDGHVDKDELHVTLRRELGLDREQLPDAELNDLFAFADSVGVNKVNTQDLCEFMRHRFLDQKRGERKAAHRRRRGRGRGRRARAAAGRRAGAAAGAAPAAAAAAAAARGVVAVDLAAAPRPRARRRAHGRAPTAAPPLQEGRARRRRAARRRRRLRLRRGGERRAPHQQVQGVLGAVEVRVRAARGRRARAAAGRGRHRDRARARRRLVRSAQRARADRPHPEQLRHGGGDGGRRRAGGVSARRAARARAGVSLAAGARGLSAEAAGARSPRRRDARRPRGCGSRARARVETA